MLRTPHTTKTDTRRTGPGGELATKPRHLLRTLHAAKGQSCENDGRCASCETEDEDETARRTPTSKREIGGPNATTWENGTQRAKDDTTAEKGRSNGTANGATRTSEREEQRDEKKGKERTEHG